MLNSSELLDVLSESFFVWFAEDVMPPLYATVLTAILLVGLSLNPCLIYAIVKQRLHSNPPYEMILHMLAVDVVATITVLLPAIVLAATHSECNSTFCHIIGTWVTTFYIMTFVYLFWIAMERSLKVYNESWHSRIFQNRKIRPWIIIILSHWMLAYLYALLCLPELNFSHMYYTPQKYQSDFQYNLNVPHAVTHLTVTYILGFVLTLILYCFMVHKRIADMKHVQEFDSLSVDGMMSRSSTTLSEGERADSPHTDPQHRTTRNVTTPSSIKVLERNLGTPGPSANSPPPEPTSEMSMQKFRHTINKLIHLHVFEVHQEHHVALTGCIIWLTVSVCWLPYVAVAFTRALRDSVWDGLYPFAVICAYFSIVAKPIICFTHNKIIKLAMVQTYPRLLQRWFEANQEIEHRVTGPVDRLLFKQPGSQASGNFWTRESLVRTVKVKMAAAKWTKAARSSRISSEHIELTEEPL